MALESHKTRSIIRYLSLLLIIETANGTSFVSINLRESKASAFIRWSLRGSLIKALRIKMYDNYDYIPFYHVFRIFLSVLTTSKCS